MFQTTNQLNYWDDEIPNGIQLNPINMENMSQINQIWWMNNEWWMMMNENCWSWKLLVTFWISLRLGHPPQCRPHTSLHLLFRRMDRGRSLYTAQNRWSFHPSPRPVPFQDVALEPKRHPAVGITMNHPGCSPWITKTSPSTGFTGSFCVCLFYHHFLPSPPSDPSSILHPLPPHLDKLQQFTNLKCSAILGSPYSPSVVGWGRYHFLMWPTIVFHRFSHPQRPLSLKKYGVFT